jgi:murein DD-endopeptidase MepM/ murein hydrolase activator NlpD
VKIVLYSDYTWKYYKNPAFARSGELFNANWSSSVPNPYKVSLKAFPDEVRIWVVDSLDQYHCPDGPCKVYSGFGYRHSHNHQGVDLPLKQGDPVYATFDGKVRMSKYYHGYGNLVIIRHTNGLETFYGHLSKRMVAEGDWVSAGQVIGLGGATGRASGVHLHFETRYQGFAFDPQWLIDFSNGRLRHRLLVLNKSYFNPKSNYDQDFNDEIALSEKESESIASMTGDASSGSPAPNVCVPAEAKVHIPAGTANNAVAMNGGDSSSIRKVSENCEGNAVAKSKPVTDNPKPAKSVHGKKYHTVRSGDTLYSIAKRNNTSVKELCRLNSLSAGSKLHPGQRIWVK